MTSGTGKPVAALGGAILGGVGGGIVASHLPITGSQTAVNIALIAVAALVAWGVGYITHKKLS